MEQTSDDDRPQQRAALSRAGSPLPQFLLLLGGLALCWVSAQAIFEQSGILAPAFLTVNLFIVAYPVQRGLNSWGVPRLIGSIISGLIVIAILLTFFGALAWSVAMFIQEIPQYQASFTTLYASFIEWLHQRGLNETQLLEQLQAQLSPSNLVSVLQSVTSSLTGIFSMLVITVTVIFVMVIDSMTFEWRANLLRTWQPSVAEGIEHFTRGVRSYWVVSSVFGVIVAVLDALALLYMGVPLAIVWGVLSFLTNYIPNIGFVMGLVPPAIMALMANDPMTALLVVVAYCVINFVVQSIIMPKFTGESVGVTATVSLLSLLFWSWALGPLGAILALPATLLAKSLLIDIDPSLRWLNVFVASDPRTGAPASVTQAAEEAGSGDPAAAPFARPARTVPAAPEAADAPGSSVTTGAAAARGSEGTAPRPGPRLPGRTRPTDPSAPAYVIGQPGRSRRSVLAAPGTPAEPAEPAEPAKPAGPEAAGDGDEDGQRR